MSKTHKRSKMSVIVLFGLALLMAGRVFAGDAQSFKGKIGLGVSALGYYEISNYESLYIQNTPTSNIRTSGAGFVADFEYGLAPRFTLGGDLGFSYSLTQNKLKSISKRSFFIGDVLGRYYFANANETVQPFVALGGGVLASSIGAAPLVDLGGGTKVKLTDNVFLNLQLLYKTAIIHNRIEASFGLAYRF